MKSCDHFHFRQYFHMALFVFQHCTRYISMEFLSNFVFSITGSERLLKAFFDMKCGNLGNCTGLDSKCFVFV